MQCCTHSKTQGFAHACRDALPGSVGAALGLGQGSVRTLSIASPVGRVHNGNLRRRRHDARQDRASWGGSGGSDCTIQERGRGRFGGSKQQGIPKPCTARSPGRPLGHCPGAGCGGSVLQLAPCRCGRAGDQDRATRGRFRARLRPHRPRRSLLLGMDQPWQGIDCT